MLLFFSLDFYPQILFMTFTFLIQLLTCFKIIYLESSIFFLLPLCLFYRTIFTIFSNLLSLFHLFIHF